jgi:succinate-semialdehyde dehydrogenase/glutarate-semialdehyde dehydrogenase
MFETTTSTVRTMDPSTGLVLATYPTTSPREIEAVVDRAVIAQAQWEKSGWPERSALLLRLAEATRNNAERLAQTACREMGKPIAEARAEVEKCAWVCEHYAEQGPIALADVDVTANGSRSWITYAPLGVILAIMPWNFPFWQVYRFATAALMAGNAGILKHAASVTASAMAIEEVFRDADAPTGLFQAIIVAEPDVPGIVAGLIADPRVAAATLTGSERAGSSLASLAGAAVKKTVLELGGSDPFVVREDADLDVVIPKAVASRFLNGGQSCLAAKRFIVHQSLVEEFSTRLATAVDALVVGDPFDPATQVGPMARQDLAEKLRDQLARAVAEGGRLHTSRTTIDLPGAWVAPAVVAVDAGSTIMVEETFGPIAAVVACADDDEAIELANDTPYGLGASVWSRDAEAALAVGRRIRSGAVFINAVVASDPRLPFGGIKRSGFGRELGDAGIREFTNLRTVLVG